MEEVRELKNGEVGKRYLGCDTVFTIMKAKGNKITVDKYNFVHSTNDEPAIIKDIYKCWLEHGRRHRLNGPGFITYYEDGTIEGKMYYINGKKLLQEEWEIEVNRINMLNEI